MLCKVTHNPVIFTAVSQKCKQEGAGKKNSSDISFFFHIGYSALAMMGMGQRSDYRLCKADVTVNYNICKLFHVASYKHCIFIFL